MKFIGRENEESRDGAGAPSEQDFSGAKLLLLPILANCVNLMAVI
jgi:hypothetical protein